MSGIYSEILSIFLNASGVGIDDMDQDFLDNESDQGVDSDDEAQEATVTTGYSIPFDVSNPHNPTHPHYMNQKFSSTGTTVRQKIAALSLGILRTVFDHELQETIKKQQQENAVCQMLNGMTVGESSGKMADLAALFGNLK